MERILTDILHSLAWLLVAPLLAFCGGYVAIRAVSFLAAVARKRLFTATGTALLALALGLLPTIAKRNAGESSGASLPREESPVGEAALSPLQETFRIEAIAVHSNGAVTLTAAWPIDFLTIGQTLDVLGKENIRDETWTWLTNSVITAGTTNISWTLENQSPSNHFYKVVVRDTFTDMGDPDCDGLPNVYELHHGTNPWVPDSSLVPRLTVGPEGAFATIAAAVAESEDYSVIELDPSVRHDSTDFLGVQIPQHPIMLTTTNAYAVIRATGMAAFMLPTNTTSRTLFRNLYLLLDRGVGAQSGFWCGGNLPWAGASASATFENVYVRMPNPGVEYRGWQIYRSNAQLISLHNCTLNASGATWTVGVDAFGAPPLEIDGCSFVNFPPDGASGTGCGILLRTSGLSDGGSDVTVSHTLFDESFTNAWPLGRFDAAVPYSASFSHCLLPRDFPLDYPPDVAADITVTNAALAWCGVPFANSPSVTLGIGSLAPIGDYPPIDADGDTLPDYTETYDLGTDPWLADSDNDGIPDAVELSEQTNPVDGLNFCFVCTAVVSNVDAVYTNGCCSYLIGQEISSPVVSFIGSASVELPHFAVTNGVVPRFVAWIDVNANGVWDVGEPRTVKTLTVTNHVLFVSCDLLLADGDTDGDMMPDVWEVMHGLCPTNNADAFDDSDGDALPNLFEYRCSTDPCNALDGSNTVYSILARGSDDRIRLKVHALDDVRHIYLNYTNSVLTGGDIVPNTSAWTYGLDFSPVGVKRARAGNVSYSLRPILISDRHVIEATHCDPATNDVVWFRAPGGTMYERTIVGLKRCQTYANDVSIGILNSPLPQEIAPVKFLPENYRQFIWDAEHLPTLRINKYSQAVVQEISYIPVVNNASYSQTLPWVQYRISDDITRESFRTDVMWGDSGHANFLVAGGELIFLFPTHVRANGWLFGTSCLSILLKDEIETMMNDLCEEQGVTNRYSIQQFDFSSLIAN